VKLSRRQLRKLIIETTTPTLQDIQAAQKDLNTRDLSSIATHLGASEDEVADILAGGFGLSKMDPDDAPGEEFKGQIGGGLGRGLPLARENLKNALDVIYTEVVDRLTDEYDPDGEGVMADETMGMAAEDTAQEINAIVKAFYENIGALGHSRHGDFYKSKSDYSDEYEAMGKSGRFYDK